MQRAHNDEQSIVQISKWNNSEEVSTLGLPKEEEVKGKRK